MKNTDRKYPIGDLEALIKQHEKAINHIYFFATSNNKNKNKMAKLELDTTGNRNMHQEYQKEQERLYGPENVKRLLSDERLGQFGEPVLLDQEKVPALTERLDNMINEENEMYSILTEIHVRLNAFQLEDIPDKEIRTKDEGPKMNNIFEKCNSIAYQQRTNLKMLRYFLERLNIYL